MLKRICRACGKTFDGGPRAWYCPTCRTERMRQHEREYKQSQRAGSVRKLGSTAICELCGKPYTVNSGQQRYCPDCGAAHLKLVDNAQSRAWNAKNPAKVKMANDAFRSRNNGRCRKELWPNNIRELRIKAGLSQSELGEMVGQIQTRISAWERGLRKPGIKNMSKLADALGVDVSQLSK